MGKNLHSIIEREEYTRSYATKYVAEIKHLGLGKFRVLKDFDPYILQNKVNGQFNIWDEQWKKKEIKRIKDENRKTSNNLANEKTLEAKKAQKDLEDILMNTLEVDDTVDWSTLKDRTKFKESNPKRLLGNEISNVRQPTTKTYVITPEKPNINNYKPKLNFFDKILSSRKKEKIDAANSAYESALKKWNVRCEEVKSQHKKVDEDFQKITDIYNSKIDKIKKKYNLLEKKWKQDKEEFYSKQKENNSKIDELEQKYLSKDEEAVLHYSEIVLNNSICPEYFPKDFQLEYNTENGIMIVEYVLPSLDVIPTLNEVKYIITRDELREYHITESQKAKTYDKVIYKMILRTIHELFESDKANAINSVVFNGWVESINKGTGMLINNCIVSLKADKTEFERINLSQVDPKICFKNLKGVGSSKLSGLIPIQPIIQIDKSDKRFVSSYDVATKIEGVNLAIMSWEDFEHLIRELFEKEFSVNGGEVKVTQTSRDGGVDAIAFDPDPIRGGKIVIQAKRYTNTVGVSAVRDLYGTVMNEGATKGILVTTADYGPEAYTFAQNKPITLLNGSNLLYLLEKHGHKSRIDLKEAKEILKDQL